MTETSCFEISELIKAQNRWEAWKYYLINELEVLDFDNRRKQKGYM
jgi:hypothetical protein